jgi:hypothetical protein
VKTKREKAAEKRARRAAKVGASRYALANGAGALARRPRPTRRPVGDDPAGRVHPSILAALAIIGRGRIDRPVRSRAAGAR